MIQTYKVLVEYKTGRTVHEVGSEVELNKGEATDLLESGNIELEKEGKEDEGNSDKVQGEVDAKLHPTPETLEDIKVAGAESKEAGEAAPDQTNEERNFNTGSNLVGVNSPDPSVGEIVPVDLVMPGQKVDPDSGNVIGWIGNHTM